MIINNVNHPALKDGGFPADLVNLVDKLEVMLNIVWSCIFEQNKHIGVLLPNYTSVKKFNDELKGVIDERLLQLKCNNIRKIETSNGVMVLAFNSVNSMRGTTLNTVYVANDLTKKQYDEFVVSMIPTLRGGPIISFLNT